MTAEKDAIPHIRALRPGRPDLGLIGTVIEQRGVRSYVQNVFTSPEDTNAWNDDDPKYIGDSLRRHAIVILKDAGEKAYFDVVSVGADPKATTELVATWYRDINQKYGVLAPVSIAARFLAAMDRVGITANAPLAERWDAIFELCEAWHWLHFEQTGEHSLALAGLKASQGRSAGPQVRLEARQRADKIISNEFKAYYGADILSETNAAADAIDLVDNVNGSLKVAGLKPYSAATIEKTIRRIRKDAKKLIGQSANENGA